MNPDDQFNFDDSINTRSTVIDSFHIHQAHGERDEVNHSGSFGCQFSVDMMLRDGECCRSANGNADDERGHCAGMGSSALMH